MSFMRGNLLAKSRKLVKGLAMKEPLWFKAMEKDPPATFPRAPNKLKPLCFPEDNYVNKFYKKHPQSKFEDAIKMSDFDPPAARVFAWRVLELKEHGITEEDAVAVADMEYRSERKLKKKSFSRLKEIAKHLGKGTPPNPYPSAVKEIQAEERKFIRDRFHDPQSLHILNRLKQERAQELLSRRG